MKAKDVILIGLLIGGGYLIYKSGIIQGLVGIAKIPGQIAGAIGAIPGAMGFKPFLGEAFKEIQPYAPAVTTSEWLKDYWKRGRLPTVAEVEMVETHRRLWGLPTTGYTLPEQTETKIDIIRASAKRQMLISDQEPKPPVVAVKPLQKPTIPIQTKKEIAQEAVQEAVPKPMKKFIPKAWGGNI